MKKQEIKKCVYYSGTPEIETRISGSGNIFNEN